MTMLTLNGQVLNVFDQPASTDKATGEVRPAKSRVQLLAVNELQNGQVRNDLVTLTAEDPELYRKMIGRQVTVPVGAFVAGGAVMFYALKGTKPRLAEGAPAASAPRAA